MSTPLPPIYRDCRRLLVHTEEMVRRFARYHKYTVGADLRRAAMQLMRTVNQAVHDKARQPMHVERLVWQVDDYKLSLQLAMDVGAFKHSIKGSEGRAGPSFNAFETAATLAAAIGKQCGGWHLALARRQRTQQATGSKPPPPAAARPASLSARAAPAASAEAIS